MRKHFVEELDDLKERLLYMGGLVETSLHRGVHAFLERNTALAESVMQEIEPEINSLQVEIDQEVLRLLALQQPMAVDLRFLAAVLKITNDLERIGDLAVNIVQAAVRPHELGPAMIDLPRMAERTQFMVHTALDSLVSRDGKLARQVLVTDDDVDQIRDQIFRELIQRMTREPEAIEIALSLLFVTRNLERISDHATNIAEDVIFWVEGVDVRHHLQP